MAIDEFTKITNELNSYYGGKYHITPWFLVYMYNVYIHNKRKHQKV